MVPLGARYERKGEPRGRGFRVTPKPSFASLELTLGGRQCPGDYTWGRRKSPFNQVK
jgi:hypothetical protein